MLACGLFLLRFQTLGRFTDLAQTLYVANMRLIGRRSLIDRDGHGLECGLPRSRLWFDRLLALSRWDRNVRGRDWHSAGLGLNRRSLLRRWNRLFERVRVRWRLQIDIYFVGLLLPALDECKDRRKVFNDGIQTLYLALPLRVVRSRLRVNQIFGSSLSVEV